MNKLNKQHEYGLDLVLLCVDEGIDGYRDRSIDTVHENQRILGLMLEIVSYEQIFGITMDEIVSKIGKKGNCTYCGILRRQSLEEAARKMNVDCIVTGHNAEDLAETILLNFFRGDISRLRRCTLSKTKEQLALRDNIVDAHISNARDESMINIQKALLTEETDVALAKDINIDQPKIICQDEVDIQTNFTEDAKNDPKETNKFLSLARCKPFKYSYQKEIVFYAYFKKLPYFSTECTYAPGASRGDFRTLIKVLEKVDSEVILKIIKSGEKFLDDTPTFLKIRKCLNCSHPTSSSDQICVACGMVEKLKNMTVSSCCSK